MDPVLLVVGTIAGALATAAMLPAEWFAFRRWGLRGVFEWHEVHASLFGFQSHRKFGALSFAGHVAFGGVGGGALALGLEAFPVPTVPAAVAWGLALWAGTLVLHEVPTAVHPWRDPMGRGPPLASLAGHLLYGAALGILYAALRP